MKRSGWVTAWCCSPLARARVLECLEVPFPRPRPPEVRKLREFVELKEYLWSRIQGMESGVSSQPVAQSEESAVEERPIGENEGY